MRDFGTALALVFVIEGILLALFPETTKRLAEELPAIPSGALRIGGLIAACVGVAAVWLIRRS
ncbi:MAG TPA: DUF2065 domain-containing protein [Stellaceae bacterium]|nr:DUF2065 domain-containing protein [Stellaceae bacterium]